MLVFLSCKPKQIAWFFVGLLYADLVLTPLSVRSERRMDIAPKAGAGYRDLSAAPGSKANSREYIPVTKENLTANTVSATNKRAPFTGGPSQPEMQSFSSVGNSNLVDLFSGDFSYSIPLMDVGGYPVSLGYRAGVSMDQEASWCGLGWNINPGTITRNMRGLPDDFNGTTDSIRKVMSIHENKTIGVTAGADLELVGLPLRVGASLGVFHNNYKGWGLEQAINASINSGTSAKGPLSGGLSITNNTQEGLTIAPSLSMKLWQYQQDEQSGATGSLSISLPYNSRSGLKGLQISAGVRQYYSDQANQSQSRGYSSDFSSMISFASPSFTPSITMPYTSRQFSFTGKVGLETKVVHPDFYISGYVSKQRIDPKDTVMALPSYGYMYYQDGAKNRAALLDFNREKELPYREKPALPHIAIPSYTYDAFSITGEGTGGMFRAYRGDIGFVYDHYIRTKDESDRISVDVGIGDIVHGGVDLNINRAFTQNGPWLNQNPAQQVIDFKQNNANYEAVYLRNPGEKAVNSKDYYENLGGDDVVTVGLYQAGNGPLIQTTNYLNRYKNKRQVGSKLLTPSSVVKPQRDKRTQVISYLTAREASVVGLSKYIDNYTPNQFTLAGCTPANMENVDGNGTGLPAEYYRTRNLTGTAVTRTDAGINFDWGKGAPNVAGFPSDRFSIRWNGRVLAPATGTYVFTTTTDDGVRLWLNDSLVINDWVDHAARSSSATVNLVAGQFYKIKMEFYENGGKASVKLEWAYPGQTRQVIPALSLYAPALDQFTLPNGLIKEKRINSFRKPNHISEITVLNNDGRRYVYGIPVYNLKQKEITFAANGKDRGNAQTGLVGYTNGTDNTAGGNRNGKDWYYNSEETPAYAHSFLLTAIVSADYADVTSNGISDDDIGDAVKFNYSKVCGIANPFGWRAPFGTDSATFNQGLKTDYRDDKGNYTFGQKELWYLHSIESKTMIATFVTEGRNDLPAINERGTAVFDGSTRRLKEINLYSKADFVKLGTAARPVKTVHFEYAYDLCPGVYGAGTGKLTLKKVWFTYNGNNKGVKNPYVFNYNSKNPSYNIKSYDRWGNYKDPLQNPGSTASNIITNAEYPYALQDSAAVAANAASWNLDSIYLPSGGSLKIEYESDDYAYVQNKRAMQLFKIRALGNSTSLPSDPSQLYNGAGDNLYVFVTVPSPVSNTADIYRKYLADIKKLYFRLYVNMPGDAYGSGSEYVPCYADLDAGNSYGMVNANTIWIKVAGISLKGDGGGSYSPLAKAAIQFLRLNLPSKAYPGSEVGDNIDLDKAVRMIASLGTNIRTAFESYDRTARNSGYVSRIDTSRSFIRLNNPYLKKYGGGHRVKRITIYDNWDKMTGQRAAVYGQQYIYTTQKEINGVKTTISSGVASYEPGLGGDENPFHVPIEYVEKIAPLGPVTLGYSEEPLGESFFPAASVGYSCVRVRTINYKNRKSANGYEESKFYTAYDFPTYTDHSVIDGDTKKRFKPTLANFLRINARHYISLSQGFKVELNDMHGKLRSKASYPETDSVNPTSYTENVYRVEDPSAEFKHLANSVMAMKPDGTIDTAALIGKDVELMVDMREQQSITNGYNVNLNTDLFTIPWPLPPFFIIPSFLNLAQREENIYRSAATMKVIQRYGILDSVIVIDKGSKVSTKDMLYDAETGDVILRRTQNEFNKPLYNFNYPAHWAYDGMGLAYRNIGVVLDHVTLRDGKIVSALPLPDTDLFANGDEILIGGKQKTNSTTGTCLDTLSTFPLYNKIWAVDTSAISGKGSRAFYFVDRDGKPFTAYDVSFKIIRSGRRNMGGTMGAVSTMNSPLVKNNTTQQYELVLNAASKVIDASATEYSNYWNKNVYCTGCPSSYASSGDGGSCVLDTAAAIPGNFTVCFRATGNPAYSSCGSFIYSQYGVSYAPFIRSQVSLSNPFWQNVGKKTGYCGYTPLDTLTVTSLAAAASLKTASALTLPDTTASSLRTLSASVQATSAAVTPLADVPHPIDSTGPLNRSAIWMCEDPNFDSTNRWVGFNVPVVITVPKIYYIGMAGDNRVRFFIDGVEMREDNPANNGQDGENFKIWHIFPMFLSAQTHVLRIQGYNAGSVAGFGVEIYGATEEQLRNATNYTDAQLIFSTRDIVGRSFPQSYSCPLGYTLDSANGHYVCRSVLQAVKYANPFINGAFGNWRAMKSYVYYTTRAETDPAAATNIAKDGAYADFAAFWQQQPVAWLPKYDSTRWVWNSEVTQYNRKGFETESKDPLGRYNAGLYGYNLTMPTAVIQNSRQRESAFEGFEDYGFETQACDSSCKDKRHIDFTAYINKFTTTQKHSGKTSLKLNASEKAALSVTLSDSLQENRKPVINFVTTSNVCLPGVSLLSKLNYVNDSVPKFSPSKGKKMVLSAWVREDQDCKCVSYTNNRIVVGFTGSTTSYTFMPTGNIIEGWQRYESVFDVPVSATDMIVSMESTGSPAVYFDDLRIQPFNANMKSFVFNPTNLRLMAELDENNYATFYEYDDDGTLIRLKKETERGIKTIKETRSALLKQ
jgi:hypothetical protein